MDEMHQTRGCPAGVWVMIALVLAVLVSTPGAAWAGQATPAVDDGDPVECTVDPRPFPLDDGTPAVGVEIPPVTTTGPYTPPTGEPADDSAVEGITATVRETIACANAGETRRMLSLFSANRVRAFFVGRGAPTGAEIEAVLTRPATPVTEASQLELVSVTEPRLLFTGRVGALVETRSGETTFVDFIYFVEEDDRWLIDDSVAIDSSTQVLATPAA